MVADHVLKRSSYLSAQPCSTQGAASGMSLWRGVLNSAEVRKFGTSADVQEIDAVDLINNVQRSRSVCGPLVEIGVYKGWFIAVLAGIAVSRGPGCFTRHCH
jgi:hypothetical protein